MKTFNNFIKEHKVTLSSSDKEKFKNKKAYDFNNSRVARKNAWGRKSLSSNLSSEIKKQFLPISKEKDSLLAQETEGKTRERTNILRRQGDRRKRGILGDEIDRREGDRRKGERRFANYKTFSKYLQKNDRRKSERRDENKSNENRKIAERRAGKNRKIKSNERRTGKAERREEPNFYQSLFGDFRLEKKGERRKEKKPISNERRNKDNSKKTDIDILAPILGKANVTGNVNKKMIEKEFYRIHDKLVEAKKKGKLTRGDVEQYEKLRELVYK